MSLTINPVAALDKNGYSGPPDRVSVYTPTIALGIEPADYGGLFADANATWFAGLNPGGYDPGSGQQWNDIVAYNSTYQRGIVGSTAESNPTVWWMSGDAYSENGQTVPSVAITDNETWMVKALELISRFPERAANNYEIMGNGDTYIGYDEAVTVAINNKYTLINCTYPTFYFGELLTSCETILNLEAGYWPSYHGILGLYNLANPKSDIGYGSRTWAYKHASHEIVDATAGGTGIPDDPFVPFWAGTAVYKGMGTDAGITFGDNIGIRWKSGADLVGTGVDTAFDHGFIFEGCMDVSTGTSNFTLFQITANTSPHTEVIRFGWNNTAGAFELNFAGGGKMASSAMTRPTGRHYFAVYVPNSTSSTILRNAQLIIDNGSVIELTSGTSVNRWTYDSYGFNFGIREIPPTGGGDVTTWDTPISIFYNARIYRKTAAFASDAAAQTALETLKNANFSAFDSIWNLP